jgi:hypothetical protein
MVVLNRIIETGSDLYCCTIRCNMLILNEEGIFVAEARSVYKSSCDNFYAGARYVTRYCSRKSELSRWVVHSMRCASARLWFDKVPPVRRTHGRYEARESKVRLCGQVMDKILNSDARHSSLTS